MTNFVALLRAINVGGTGKLPMKELSAMCWDLGFQDVRTYIQSGNVVFESALPERTVRTELERVLSKRMGKKIDVFVRTASELSSILKANPFPEAEPAKVAVFFCPTPRRRGYRTTLSRTAESKSGWAGERSTSTIRTAWGSPN